jgi:hypothetical protein
MFPDPFPNMRAGVIHRDKEIRLDEVSLSSFNHAGENFHTIYSSGDTYDFLQVGDTIAVYNPKKDAYLNAIRITFIDKKAAGAIIEAAPHPEYARQTIERQIGRPADPAEPICVLEFKRAAMPIDPGTK